MKNYSRRDLYALGEPLGESVTRMEAGRRVYGGGGGISNFAGAIQPAAQMASQMGTNAQPTQAPTQQPAQQPLSQATSTPTGNIPSVLPQTQTETQAGVADYAQPVVNTMLGSMMQNLFDYDQYGNAMGMKGYTPYSYNPADYFAAFTPLQEQAQAGIASLQNPWQSDYASGSMMDYMNRAANMQYNPTNFGYDQVRAPQLQQYQMGPAERVGTQSFVQPGTAEQFMSPFMQNVVDVQQREAKRQAKIAVQTQQAAAVRAGAYGGGRDLIQRGQANRALQAQLQSIQAQGLQNAYQQAQQQFNAEQGYGLQAGMANQQAGLTTGQQNLNALLGIQQLGAGQNLTAQQLNQAARQQANQLAAQQQQFGANYALQGLQAAMGGAGQLGGFGTQGLQNQLNVFNAQNQAGAAQQALQQQIINQGVQNYNTAQQYPYMQLGFMQNMLQGLPITASSQQQYQAAPSTVSQLAGLGLGLGSLLRGMGGTGGTGTGTSPGGIVGGLNNVGGGIGNLISGAGNLIGKIPGAVNSISNVVSDIGGWLGLAEGGQVSEDPLRKLEDKINKNDIQGLIALAMSQLD